jgi:hypothetical protein
MNQRVRFTLSTRGKAVLQRIQGNGNKTLTPDGPDTYIATLYDVITIFGRQMDFRANKGVSKPKSYCVFLNESIEILPPAPGHDPPIFHDDP